MSVALTSTVDMTMNVLMSLLIKASFALKSMSAMPVSVTPLLIVLISLVIPKLKFWLLQ